jgi:predicted RNA binding protein YcfA (HicA-like mRNA interferase family)
MPKLKVLSGKDLVKIFNEFGFTIQSQKGSHIKLSRLLLDQKQTLVIPNHTEIDIGTLKAIYRQSLKYISEKELVSYFYNV